MSRKKVIAILCTVSLTLISIGIICFIVNDQGKSKMSPVNGTWIADSGSSWELYDNSFKWSKSKGDNNYWKGSYQSFDGKEAVSNANFADGSIDDLIDSLNQRRKEILGREISVNDSDIHAIIFNPTELVVNGLQDKSSLDKSGNWMYVWIIFNDDGRIRAEAFDVQNERIIFLTKE